MIHLRIAVPSEHTAGVLEILDDDAVSSVQVLRGVSLRPSGDVVEADVAREGTDEVVEALRRLGVHRTGSIHIEPVSSWMSYAARGCDDRIPGASADAVVWPAVTQAAYEDSELNWTYLSFMTLATLIAGVAIVLDSPILVIGAMVLGPEFGAVAATALAVVRRRWELLRLAGRTLVLGFVVGILVTAAVSFGGRLLGWVAADDLTQGRENTSFVYTPDRWSFVVAVIAGAAGVLAMTSSRTGGLSGVFISVTTVPASANIAMGLAFQEWGEVRGSGIQLLVNLVGMVLSGCLTLWVQQRIWAGVDRRRHRRRGRAPT